MKLIRWLNWSLGTIKSIVGVHWSTFIWPIRFDWYVCLYKILLLAFCRIHHEINLFYTRVSKEEELLIFIAVWNILELSSSSPSSSSSSSFKVQTASAVSSDSCRCAKRYAQINKIHYIDHKICDDKIQCVC